MTSTAHAHARSTTGRRALAATLGAALASVVLASSVAGAITWQHVAVSPGDERAFHGRVVATGPRTGVAAFRQSGGAFIRRTTNGGTSWTRAFDLVGAKGASQPVELSAFGAFVSAVWTGGTDFMYRRSTNRGQAWDDAVELSPVGPSTSNRASSGEVAHGADGQVTAVWTQAPDGEILARTSLDNGRTWGQTQLVALGIPPGQGAHSYFEAAVAIGTGVTYIAYIDEQLRLVVQRSLDKGRSWGAPVSAFTTSGGVAIEAAGSTVMVIGRVDTKPAIRRSTNKGATWSPPQPLANVGGQPTIDYRATYWITTFTGPESRTLIHRFSQNEGRTWSPPSRVKAGAAFSLIADSATYLDRHVVLYTDSPGGGNDAFEKAALGQ
jgi:hypothetical protein